MDYDYIRRLIQAPTEEELEILVASLNNEGMETFAKGNDQKKYLSSVQGDVFPDYEIFVSGADYEQAVEVVKNLGYQDKIAPDALVNSGNDRIQSAEKEFFKKRKMIWFECGLVVFLVVLYMIYMNFK